VVDIMFNEYNEVVMRVSTVTGWLLLGSIGTRFINYTQ